MTINWNSPQGIPKTQRDYKLRKKIKMNIKVKCLCNELSQEDLDQLQLEKRMEEADDRDRSFLDSYNEDLN